MTELNKDGIITTYEYDANGNLTKRSSDTGISTQYAYNKAGLIMSAVNTDSGTVANMGGYAYYLNGLKYNEVCTTRTTDGTVLRHQTYDYDKAGRLIKNYIGGSYENTVYNEYTYDLRGNRISSVNKLSETGETTEYEYDLGDHLLSEATTDGGVLQKKTYYSYDERGNLTGEQTRVYSADGLAGSTAGQAGGMNDAYSTKTYRYDRFNRLVKYTDGDTVAEYEYNADNLRTAKTVNGKRTEYVWDGTNLMYEHGAAGTHKYAYDPTGVHMMDNDTYLKDGHGNVTGMYDENGEFMSDTYYDAFGNVAYGDTPNPFGYSGEYLDNETGLIYLRNRYYDSSTGRFITEDPAKDGTNWYSYCAGDPVNFVDPWGLEYVIISGGAYAPNDDWPYEFIAPAIQKINDLQAENSNESISWIVSNIGYTDEQIQEIMDVSNDLGVNFVLINSSAELQNYINSKNTRVWDLSQSRIQDPIRKFVVFSHGEPGSIELGYFHNGAENFSLDFDWIRGVSMYAFDNPNTALYSCRAGNDVNQYWGSNFAQEWVNVTGGRTWAPVGRTSYYNVTKQGVFDKIGRQFNNISANASYNYPTEDYSENAYFMNFYRSW